LLPHPHSESGEATVSDFNQPEPNRGKSSNEEILGCLDFLLLLAEALAGHRPFVGNGGPVTADVEAGRVL